MSKRLKAMGQQNYQHGFEVRTHRRMLDIPLKLKKPQTIFVNSMSDLFHKNVSTNFIYRVFKTMNKAHWHVFQVLTKRSGRLRQLNNSLQWAENIWMGVSIETPEYMYRIDDLRETGAAVKFLSIEPLLAPMGDLDLGGIDWVIVGGESGPHARPMEPDWVMDIRDQCLNAKVPFFFKQWGGTNKKKTGRVLEGKIWDEMPMHPSLA
jgi:protein gp37